MALRGNPGPRSATAGETTRLKQKQTFLEIQGVVSGVEDGFRREEGRRVE